MVLYVPAVESLGSRGIGTRIVFWRHATARDLEAVATAFVPLDNHLDEIAL
jgi:hypothetical protein